MLDNARELVADAEPDDDAPTAASTEGSVGGELPPPDPSRFEGANRIVNLLTGPDTEVVEVDVWGRRTFENGPILLASDLGFGDASDYVAAPPEYTVVAVGAGAGPDGVALAEIINAVDGERITTVIAAGVDGEPAATHLFEVGSDSAVEPPSDGAALLVVDAPNLAAHGDELMAELGSDRFEIGDGEGACRAQRREASGLEPEIVGDPEPVEIEVAPGPTRVSVHPWVPTSPPCSLPPVASIDVDVAVDSITFVLVARAPGGEIAVWSFSAG